jgi:hypothetical protein
MLSAFQLDLVSEEPWQVTAEREENEVGTFIHLAGS